jgi:hypothetical protein
MVLFITKNYAIFPFIRLLIDGGNYEISNCTYRKRGYPIQRKRGGLKEIS